VGPEGASVVVSTGMITCTPSEEHGTSNNVVSVRVTDNGVPSLSDTKSFTVVVKEANNAPVLAAIANQTIAEGSTLTLTLTASDWIVPANGMTYSMVAGPVGAGVGAGTGVFTWTPSEAQGPSTNVVTVRVRDNGVPSLSDTRSFTVVVNEVNIAPLLLPIADQTIAEGSTLTVTLIASD